MWDGDKFELPGKIERFLAALSRIYGQEGERLLQEIIVNAQIRVEDGRWRKDYVDEHCLYLVVPEQLFLATTKNRSVIEHRIRDGLNELHHVHNEIIGAVFLEMDVAEDRDWRQDTGLLMAGGRAASPETTSRIWEDHRFRLFMSHKSEVRAETGRLKEALAIFGVSAFVAHEDILPTQEWQDEIENALLSMDAFAALMTADFHSSDWTDQEVGFALARGVPVVAVNLGRNPYGFIGKFQALRAKWDTAAVEIVKLLLRHDRMLSAYIHALQKCPSFDAGNQLALVLPAIEKASEQQIDEMVVAVNKNDQLRGAFGINGGKPSFYGGGLVPHLHRLGPRRYTQHRDGTITPEGATKQPEPVEDGEIPF